MASTSTVSQENPGASAHFAHITAVANRSLCHTRHMQRRVRGGSVRRSGSNGPRLGARRAARRAPNRTPAAERTDVVQKTLPAFLRQGESARSAPKGDGLLKENALPFCSGGANCLQTVFFRPFIVRLELWVFGFLASHCVVSHGPWRSRAKSELARSARVALSGFVGRAVMGV